MHTGVTVLFQGTGDGGREGANRMRVRIEMATYGWKEAGSACDCMIKLYVRACVSYMCLCVCLQGERLQGVHDCVSVNSAFGWTNFASGTESLNKGELSESCFLGLCYNHYQMSGRKRRTDGENESLCVYERTKMEENWCLKKTYMAAKQCASEIWLHYPHFQLYLFKALLVVRFFCFVLVLVAWPWR